VTNRGTAPNRKTILLALLLASLAAAVVVFLIGRRPAPAAVPAANAPPAVAVVVAARDIREDEILVADAVEVRQVPIELRNARAVTELEAAIGKRANATILVGEQLLDVRIETAGADASETFADEVPVGMRAVAVTFDEVSGVGALVQPGDRVDVIAHLELEVTRSLDGGLMSLSRRQEGFGDGDGVGDGDDDGSESSGAAAGVQELDESIAVYVVQNRAVLAVAQALDPSEGGAVDEGAEPTPVPAPDAASDTEAESTVPSEAEPVVRPEAISATLLVTAEEAQRLVLADNTSDAPLRLSLRAPGDTTVFDGRPVQVGDTLLFGEAMEPLIAESLDRLVGDVDRPLIESDLVIVEASFEETELTVGGVLEFSATVKNVSVRPIPAGLGGAPDGFAYDEGTAYDSEGYFDEPGRYRIGLNVAVAEPQPFPYRWAIGSDLNPGQTTVVTGAVRLATASAPTRYWLGVIEEPNVVVQDGMAVTEVEVAPVSSVRVVAERGALLVEANDGADVLLEVGLGSILEVAEQDDGWYLVRSGETSGWIAEADVVPAGSDEAGPAGALPAGTPVADAVGTPVPTEALADGDGS